MKAMVLERIVDVRKQPDPLRLVDLPIPKPGSGELLVRVLSCGVCHTELDEIEGRTPPGNFPVILGHQAVGIVEQAGSEADRGRIGERVGVGWIFNSCGRCEYCLAGQENLCAHFQATGRDANGGYAEWMVAPQSAAFTIPESLSDSEAAPLLCAGVIGYRSLRLSGLQNGQTLGLTGFGASAHLVLKMARYLFPDAQVMVFSRNIREREFALQLGAAWAGAIEDSAPVKLNCIIDTTPAWKPVVEGLRNLATGGRLVINAIRKENGDIADLLQIDYPLHLWMEKEIKSVANVSRRDIREFLDIAAQASIRPEYQEYRLESANQALFELKTGNIHGAKVLRIGRSSN